MARIEIDPTDLRPGDIVVGLGEHEISGCHCDVRVTVDRPVKRSTRMVTWREMMAAQLREAQRAPHTPPVDRANAPANWAALYAWLGEQAKQGYREASENESAANLDASVGPQYMADALILVRDHMRRTDPALPYIKAIDNDLC